MEQELINVNRQNVRLTQLLGEVQRTFESIDKQRRKAASIIESHEQIMAQKALENSQLQDRLAELERTAKCMASVEHQLESNKVELSRLSAENSSLKQEIKAATKKNAELLQYKHQAAALTSELAVVRRDLEATHADTSRIKEELSSAIETNTELRSSLNSSTDQLTALLALLLERHSHSGSSEDGTTTCCSADNVNDRKDLYCILSYRSTVLNCCMFPSSSADASPLSLFLLICTLFTQQILLRQLCAFINQGALNLSDNSERLSFLLSAFALSLADDFISVFLCPRENHCITAAKSPNPIALKAALNLSSSLQDICGDSFAVLEEILLAGTLPVHLQLKLNASKIRGFFAQVLPILLSSIDMLASTGTGPYTYSSFLSTPSFMERFIFAATAYTHRALFLTFQRPFVALSSRFFNDALTLLCPNQSAFVKIAGQPEVSIAQVDCLLTAFSDQLPDNQSSPLLTLINSTRLLLSESIGNTKLARQQLQDQSHADIKVVLANIQMEASKQLQNSICEQNELKAELDRTRAELASLREEHIKTIGLLRIATDRISVAEETSNTLRAALSAQLLA